MNALLSQLADAFEDKAGITTTRNDNTNGYWSRIALAAETMSGTSTEANESQNGFMLRTVRALDDLFSIDTSPGANESRSGYLERMIQAFGDNYTGSLTYQLLQEITGYVGGGWDAYVDEPTELAVFDAAMASIYPQLDGFWLLAAGSRATGKVNRANPGTYDLAEVGTAPTFTAHKGFKSAASGSYLNTGINLTAGGLNATLDDHSFGLWAFDSTGNTQHPFGYGNVLLNPAVTTGASAQARARSGEVTNISSTGIVDPRGLHVVSRSASNEFRRYVGSELWRIQAQTTDAFSNGNLRICGWGDATPTNHYDQARFYSAAWVGASLTQAEIKVIEDALGRYLLRTGAIRPYVSTQVAGIPDTSSFTVAARLAFAYDPSLRARLVVAATADTTFSSPLYTGSYQSITQDPHNRRIKRTASGLDDDTAVRYKIEFNDYTGDPTDGTGTQALTGLLTTAPPALTPVAFRMVVGSCFAHTTSSGSTVAPLIAAQSPDLFLSLGDDTYDDNVPARADYLRVLTDDALETKRSYGYGEAGRNKWPSRQALNLAVPSFYLMDDHDAVSNDLQTGDVVDGSVLFEDVIGDVRTAYLESVPYPTLIDPGNNLASKFYYANCAFIAIDSTTERDEANGRMVSVSQLAAIKAAITEAGTLGCTLVFLISTNTWANAHEGWRTAPGAYIAQHNDLNDHIASVLDANPDMRVAVLVGDMHESAVDDGDFTDFSTGGMDGRIIQITCSPLNSTSLHALAFQWLGADSYHADSNQMMTVIDVDAANLNLTISIYNNITGSSVLVAEYDTNDLTAWGVPDTTAPTITSANSASVAEETILAHALTADETVTWSIVGGADQADFEISGSTLRWVSNGTKDFEVPDDADTNNTYVVTVRATDSATNTSDQTITITVTDVVESAGTNRVFIGGSPFIIENGRVYAGADAVREQA